MRDEAKNLNTTRRNGHEASTLWGEARC